MSAPILFLDFDGVLRIANDRGVDPQWRGEKIKALAGLCERARAEIVVISQLRLSMKPADILACIGLRLGKFFHKDWFAPVCVERWVSVWQWLEGHGMGDSDNFAILDDEARHYDVAPPCFSERLILCNSRFGFQPEKQGRQLLKLLGHEPPACDQAELALE